MVICMSVRIKIGNGWGIKNTIFAMLIYICLIRLGEMVGLPHFLIFFLDFLNLILFVNILYQRKINSIIHYPLICVQILVFGLGILIAVSFAVPILQVVWALRNYGRFLIFYCACSTFLDASDVSKIFDVLKCLFWVNFALFALQYVMGYRGDFLGGIFGVEQGSNTYCNIFLVLVITYETVCWMQKKEKIIFLFAYLGISVLMSALCELKVFFVEIVIIMMLSFLLLIFWKREFRLLAKICLLLIFCGCILVLGIDKLFELYPNFRNLLTYEGIVYHLARPGGYSNSGDVNRLTFMKTLNKVVFDEDGFLKMLGLGLGATEYSSISFFTSEFYKKFSYLHYYWFSAPWIYLECGLIGMIGYVCGFVANGFVGMKKIYRFKLQNIDSTFVITGVVLSLMTVLLFIYNQSLRLDCAYLFYFGLALVNIKGERDGESKHYCSDI